MAVFLVLAGIEDARTAVFGSCCSKTRQELTDGARALAFLLTLGADAVLGAQEPEATGKQSAPTQNAPHPGGLAFAGPVKSELV